MRKEILILFGAVALSTSHAIAQAAACDHEHEQQGVKYTCVMHPEVVMDHPGTCPKCGMKLVPVRQSKRPMPNSERAARSHEMPMEQMSMQSSINLADPMNRESSGTAWVPDSTPMYGRMFMLGDDMLMLHGAIFPRYTNVSTRRGDDRIDAPNWIMAMYSHPFSETTQLGGRLMMSLDPLTEGGRGYPLLLQSGESWHDQPLHDRQHPHDLFDELSLSLSHKVDVDLSGYFYFGYPGEPALGPPTFMHRLSAMDNPDAPLGHHWQDSTHVTFGVATAGIQWRNVKVEGSSFTGREPDEDRYDFDQPRFDSFSGRVSWNPTQNLALQFSHGYIRSPEALEPDVNRHRTTASAIYNLPLGHDTNWSNSFVWGRNNDAGEKTNSVLLETNYQRHRDTIYARWEWVEKSGHELVLKDVDLAKVFPINAVTVGYVRDLSHGNGIDVGLGGQFTLDFWPNDLDRYYGGGPSYGFEVFLRIRPSLHSHAERVHSEDIAGMQEM
ncbi:MAG TPA: heavy metal-binding domain-containing protein [Chthoniobacterales bacterium]|nr:heavy metal-binding domain-containing protein [Chthoniobacterales bacterium]